MSTTPIRPGFEEAQCQLLAAFQGQLPPDEQERIREDLRLHYDYPGEYVAFLDTWQGDGPDRRLKREIIAHSRCLDDLDPALAKCQDEDVDLYYAGEPADPSTEIAPGEGY